jgi:stage IV sporulation protein FB
MLSEGSRRSFNLKVGRLFGIEIWLHWFLLLLIVLQLLHHLWRSEDYGHPFGFWSMSVTALLLTLLLHELGHCYAAFRQGGGAQAIVLWPLGGLAYCDAPHQPLPQFWVAAAGPLVNVALAILSGGACALGGWKLLPGGTEEFALIRLFFQFLFLWNVFLLLLNLLPCYPLDGGRMLQAGLWARLESYGEASLLTLRISRTLAILALVAGIIITLVGFMDKKFAYDHPLLNSLGLGFILVSLVSFAEARALRLRLEYGEEEEGIFGYDFSRGYVSLERTAPKTRPPSLLQRLRDAARGRALARRQKLEKEMRVRLDSLLEKISREGMASLSREEQRFLESASRKIRNSRASKDG